MDGHGSDLCACEVSMPTGNQIIQITRKELGEEWVSETMEYYWQRFGVSFTHPEIGPGWDEGSGQLGKCVPSRFKL